MNAPLWQRALHARRAAAGASPTSRYVAVVWSPEDQCQAEGCDRPWTGVVAETALCALHASRARSGQIVRLRQGARRAELGVRPKGGHANRVHPKPKRGDVLANWRVVDELGSGREGRADLSFLVRCITCGREKPAFEFNLRKAVPCTGQGRERHE